MSSQVITTLPAGEPGEPEAAAGPESTTTGEVDEPGKQKNFYRHVSGAGDGLPLQTTADFGPLATSNNIVQGSSEMNEDQEHHQPNLATPSPPTSNEETSNEVTIEPDWQKKIRSLQDQILAVLMNVDKTKVDVTIGRTSIHGDKPVVMSWNRNQQTMSSLVQEENQNNTRPPQPATDIVATEATPITGQEETTDEKPVNADEKPQEAAEDGVLFFFAIKMKDEFKDEEPSEQMRKLFRNDFNNNPGTIQKKVKRSVFKKVQNEKGEMVEIEVKVNKRKVTRNIIDEKSGRVMEVETEVTTDDSDEDVVNSDGNIVKAKNKKKMRRGRTGGGQGRRDSQGENEPQQRRRKSTVVRRRKLTQEEIQKGVTADGRSLTQEEMESGVSVTRVSRNSIRHQKQSINGGQGFSEDGFDENDEEYYSDEEYFTGDDDYDSDEYDEEDDYYDDDAEIIDVSRNGQRYRFDSRGRKIGIRGRGGRGSNHPKLSQRYRRKFCGHGKPGSEEYERAKLGRSRRTSSFGEDYYSDEDDYLDDYDGYVNYLRHEFCFDEFEGYGNEYDGPKGILTSYLPDGTSVTVPKNGMIDGNKNRSPGSSAAATAGEALENELFNGGNKDADGKSPLLRSISKISTIPEEDNEYMFDEYMSNQGSWRRHDDCATPDRNGHLRPLARAVQVPNRIRRLRSRHVQVSKNLWFTGSVDKSFNSRCSKRFETKDLEEDAVHYYYYRSLPKISTNDRYLPSITTSIENIEPPKLPKVPMRRNEDLLL